MRLLALFILLMPSVLLGQFSDDEQHQIDSLTAIINDKTSHDTSLASAYVGLSEILYVSNLDTVIPLCIKAKEIAETALITRPSVMVTNSLLKTLAGALNNIGFIYKQQGGIPQALEYYQKSLEIKKEINNNKGIANSLNNIGRIYEQQGDIPKALEYYHKSLKIREEIGNKAGIAESLNNIGFIYKQQGDIPEALEYYHKSLKIREEAGNKAGIAESLNNIGLIYQNQGDSSKAMEYYQNSLKI